MIGDMVVNTSRSGTRLILIRLRLATIGAVGQRPWQRAHRLHLPSAGAAVGRRPSSGSAVVVLGGVAGQGEEDVVERRAGAARRRRARSRAASSRRSASISTAGAAA